MNVTPPPLPPPTPHRVVMYSGAAELEMRGRCSAGQKVGCKYQSNLNQTKPN